MLTDTAHMRPFVYNLCEQRNFPVLVSDLIAQDLNEQDLLTISTLSPKRNKEANSIIYRDVVLDFNKEQYGRTAMGLLRTLLTTPTAASNIRGLSLIGDPLYSWSKETVVLHNGESVEAPLRGRVPPNFLLN